MRKIPALPPYTVFSKDDELPIEDVSGPDTQAMTLEQLLGFMYPVGSIYMNASVSTNPGTLLGFGTWAAHGAGRVNVGIDATQTEFDTIGETGGAKTHTLTTAEIPSHAHLYATIRNGVNWGGGGFSTPDKTLGVGEGTTNTGGGGAHNNLQPYVVVYMWKRTA